MTPAPRDENHVPALIARSSSTNTAVVLYADPTTHRLLVDASVTISGLATAVTDGEAVDVADVGNLALGTDGSNYQILHTDSSGDLQIDILTSALPSGAATSANQTTIIGHVDGIEGLLTTIDADTGNIVTSVQLIDDAIYVDGDAWVDNASKHMLGGGVYQSTQQTIIDGDTAPFELDARGNLRTIIMDGVNQASVDTAGVDNESNTSSRLNVRSHLSYFDGSTWDRARGDSTDGLLVNLGTNNDVTNAGTFAVQVDGAALTSLQLIDDTVKTLGTDTYTETSSKGLVLAAVRRDADTTLADTTNEFTPLQVDANGYLKVEVFSGATLPVSLTSTTVTGTVAVTQSGTWDEVGINDSGNSITVDYATTGSGTATGALRVELPTNGTGVVGLNAGTNNIGDVDVASIAAGDNNIGNVDIVSGTVTTVTTLTGGGIAHDSADSGNPHKIGFKAYSPDGTTPGTAVAEGDRTDSKGDLDGRLFTNDEHPRFWSYHLDTSTAQTDASVAAAPGAGFQVVITNIIVSTGAATAMNFFLEEATTKIFGPIYLEAVAGRGFCTPAGFKKHITANTAVTITTSASIAQAIDIQGYIQAV